jgi:chromosome partitioning protein
VKGKRGKWGVGKTTLAVNMAFFNARQNKRTLLVDTDPQGNASMYILGRHYELSKSIVDYYQSTLQLNLFKPSLGDFIITQTNVPNLHLIGCDRSLEDLRTKLETKHKIFKLREGLRNSTYDYIYIDPPPANDFFSISALIAATEVLIPVDCDAFSVQAAREITKTIEEVKNDHNPELKILGIIINQYQKATKHADQIVGELESLGLTLLKPFIPSSVKIRESHSGHEPVLSLYPKHQVSEAIEALCHKIN